MTNKQKLVLVRIALSIILFAVAMIIAAGGTMNIIMFLIPYLIIGYDVLWNAVRNILRGRMLDERFLMSIATVGALALGEYPEALAVMVLYQVGELFLDVAVDKSRRSVVELMDIRPDHAVVVRDSKEIRCEPCEVEIGEVIVVRPGERIPLDGVIVDGQSTLDTSALTGESQPRNCHIGENVPSGSVNLDSVIKLRVTNNYENSTVSKILDLVESASDKKARVESFITKFARVYTPIVVAGAVVLALVPSVITGNWTEWVHRALIFLVVSCPCALVISVPLSFFGGIGGASKAGILIKGSNYMEQLARAEICVFDKTGTLTYGNFEVVKICPEKISEEELLFILAHGEYASNHPIARSICRRYRGEIDTSLISDIKEVSGKGITAVYKGEVLRIGNASFAECESSDDEDGTVIYAVLGSEYLGHIVISDAVKENAPQAVRELKEQGVTKTVMLTGDTEKIGKYVTTKVGIDEVYAELLPADKVAKLEELIKEKNKGTTLVYAGDGINDAPVLALADVGVAMGALGSDAAIEAADVVLMDDDPTKIAKAVGISKFTVNIAKQNIIFALTVKALVLILGALGITGMWLAIFADVGVSVLATLNAMRTMKTKEKI